MGMRFTEHTLARIKVGEKLFRNDRLECGEVLSPNTQQKQRGSVALFSLPISTGFRSSQRIPKKCPELKRHPQLCEGGVVHDLIG